MNTQYRKSIERFLQFFKFLTAFSVSIISYQSRESIRKNGCLIISPCCIWRNKIRCQIALKPSLCEKQETNKGAFYRCKAGVSCGQTVVGNRQCMPAEKHPLVWTIIRVSSRRTSFINALRNSILFIYTGIFG